MVRLSVCVGWISRAPREFFLKRGFWIFFITSWAHKSFNFRSERSKEDFRDFFLTEFSENFRIWIDCFDWTMYPTRIFPDFWIISISISSSGVWSVWNWFEFTFTLFPTYDLGWCCSPMIASKPIFSVISKKKTKFESKLIFFFQKLKKGRPDVFAIWLVPTRYSDQFNYDWAIWWCDQHVRSDKAPKSKKIYINKMIWIRYLSKWISCNTNNNNFKILICISLKFVLNACWAVRGQNESILMQEWKVLEYRFWKLTHLH